MSLADLIIVTLMTSLGAMILLWLVSLARKDASVADAYWGLGFVLLTWVSFFVCFAAGSSPTGRTLLIVCMVTIWGSRLAVHLTKRNLTHDEDRRYRLMREKHGEHFWWVSLFTVFLLQGAIMWFVALPAILTIWIGSDSSGLRWLDFVAILLWCLGFVFETVGDYQLSRFKTNIKNRGRVMDRGLWRYTRHPNYFGDFCVWWAHYLVAAATGAWWTIGSPLLMSFLLLRVSGVTLLEGDIAERRPDYAEYQRRTNAFFPGPPSTG